MKGIRIESNELQMTSICCGRLTKRCPPQAEHTPSTAVDVPLSGCAKWVSALLRWRGGQLNLGVRRRGTIVADAELIELWSAIRRDFDTAISLLPANPTEHNGGIARLEECLEHNELELALDELEALGESNSMPSEFWQALAVAAGRMCLTAHHARLTFIWP